MTKSGGLSSALVRRVPWLLLAKVLLSLAVVVYAATITITTTNYQAETGSSFSVSNNLVAVDKGFYLANTSAIANSTSCTSPVTFSSTPQIANNGITPGHLVYVVQVNSTGAGAGGMNYNVTFVLGSSTFGPLCIQTAVSPQNAQTITCKFDIASNSLPASPYTFKVTIQ
jgi:hypothetical protein